MAKQFLDATGLLYLWNKIKSTFLPLSGGTIIGNIIIQASQTSIEDSLKIQRNSISMPIDDADKGVIIDNTNGIKLSMPAGLGIFAINENGETVGDSTTFWTTNGLSENIDPITTEELNAVLV